MTIGAVSSFQYASSTQYQYFGTTVSTERLTQLMQEYGIQQTGNSQKDLEALYQAMYSTAKTEVSDSAKNAQGYESSKNSNTVPWASLMGQVGLAATGDLTADYATFNTKINSMQSSATSQDQQATISLLQAEASTVFVQQSQGASGSSQGQTQVSGLDIMAQLNKLYLFGG